MATVRRPAVAGTFYPARHSDLSALVDRLLATAHPSTTTTPGMPPEATPQCLPPAYIVPHAGYIYSGSTAALAYTQIALAADHVTRVVVLGPAHRVPLHGLALPGVDAFTTPLGQVPVAAVEPLVLARLPQISVNPEAHAEEHSVEVQLPFLQTILGEFELLPLVVGHCSGHQVAEVIDTLWAEPDTLVLVSSDLSHYLPYRAAQQADQVTLRQILDLDATLTHHQACGATPANGLLLSAARRGLQPDLLGACNSADTAGSRHRVVGYATVRFTPRGIR